MDVFIIYILDLFTSLLSIAQNERLLGSTHPMTSTLSVYVVDRTVRDQREADLLSRWLCAQLPLRHEAGMVYGAAFIILR